MVLSQTTHSNELRIQLKEFEEDIATLNLIKAYVSENIFARLFNRTFYFLAEVAFYSFFIIEVMAFVALLYLSDPLSDFLARWISEYIELSVDNIRPIVIFASIIVLLSSIFNLYIGAFVFKKLRQKNDKLRNIASMFNRLLEHYEERYGRVKALDVK